MSWFWIPGLCGLILVGVVLYFLQPRPLSLEGRLQAEKLVDIEPPPQRFELSRIPFNESLTQEDSRRLLAHLAEHPLPVLRGTERLMDVTIAGSPQGFVFGVHDTARARFFRVAIPPGSDLWKFREENLDRLDEPRLRELKGQARDFLLEYKLVVEEGGSMPDESLNMYRYKLALSALAGPLGYHLMAVADGKGYFCVYEDAEAVYFLLPADTTQFTMKGRPISGKRGTISEDHKLFPGRYIVEVTGVREPETAPESEPEPQPESEDDNKSGKPAEPKDRESPADGTADPRMN